MIQMENVEKHYESFKLSVSMDLQPGQITGLIGKNGAGKSTTIKLILGLIKPSAGQCFVLGKNSSSLQGDDKLDLGVCLSESGFSRELCIEDIKDILKYMYPNFDVRYFEQKCDLLNLPIHKKIGEFSTGMKAKIKVLTALSHKAKLLILDEPTSGLDVESRNEILDLMRDYMAEDESRSILITSHISSDLENLCDDIYLIHDGKIILHEDVNVIIDQYAILKMSEEVYASLEKEYILKSQKMEYGYACFTNQKQYFIDNYPDMVIENGNIDDLILMMTGGYKS